MTCWQISEINDAGINQEHNPVIIHMIDNPLLKNKTGDGWNHKLCFILSKPQPNLNSTVGFDMKMTLQTPPPTHPPTETFQALLDKLES